MRVHFVSCRCERRRGRGEFSIDYKPRTKSGRQTTEMSMRDREERGSVGEKMGVYLK